MKFRLKQAGILLICVALITSLLTVGASAALEAGVYTGTVVTTYYNPDTGEVDDGGTANAALGEGMCRSATATTALVEKDRDGNIWVTIRLLLQSNCSNVAFYTRTGYNSYSKVSYTVMAEDAGNDSIDYRFKVTDAGVKIKGTMYVAPMGRDVLWYLYVDTSTLRSGSGDFEVSIDLSTPAATSTPASTTTTTAQKPASTQKPASSQTSTATKPASTTTAANNTSDTQDGQAEDPEENTDGEDQTLEEEVADPEEILETEEEEQPEEEDPGEEQPEEEEASHSTGSVAAVIIILVLIAAGVVVYFVKKKGKARP